MKFIRAKSICYGPVRPYENVTAIVIHYIANFRTGHLPV